MCFLFLLTMAGLEPATQGNGRVHGLDGRVKPAHGGD